MKAVLFYFVAAIILSGAISGFNLSMGEINNGHVCPKIIFIPACYLVFLFFTLSFIVHLFKRRFAVFFASLFIPFALALSGTISEFMGIDVCPRTSGGIPMCHISFIFCLTILLLKYIYQRI
jgi:hypothetical protein